MYYVPVTTIHNIPIQLYRAEEKQKAQEETS